MAAGDLQQPLRGELPHSKRRRLTFAAFGFTGVAAVSAPAALTWIALIEGLDGEGLSRALGRMTSYAGVMNHMGVHGMAKNTAVCTFLGELARRGLLSLDDGSASKSLARGVGQDVGAPVVVSGLTADEAHGPTEIVKALARLEEIAMAKVIAAVSIAAAFTATVKAIAAWAPSAA